MDKLFEIVSDTHEIRVNGHLMEIDMRNLITQTAMIESNYGRDKYSTRYAKTFMQIEPKTYEYYINLSPELKEYMESELGRKLKLSNENAVFIAYIIYLNKLKVHRSWIDKFKHSYYNGDNEWYVYKLFYNSIKGKSTYKRWKQRQIEYWRM
ncbi:MAG: hypothetical protein ACRC7S_15645 [Cetobacterium sp.]